MKSFNVLSGKFQERGHRMTFKVTLPINVFPFPDENWKKENNLFKLNDGYWIYRNEEGIPIVVVYKYWKNNKRTGLEEKQYQQIVYGKDQDTDKLKYIRGLNGWKDHRPIFNIPGLIKNPTAPVILTEGEKAAEAAAKYFPDHVTTAFINGINSRFKQDYQLLQNREVILWPDNDEAGKDGFLTLAEHLEEEFRCSVSVVDVPEDLPNKWDIADPIPEELHYTPQTLLNLAKNPDEFIRYPRLDRDVINRRWVAIERSNGKQFFDRYERDVKHKETINLLYEASNPKKMPTKQIMSIPNAFKVKTTAFRRADKQIVNIEGVGQCLNTYVPVNFAPLTAAEEAETDSILEPYHKLTNLVFNQNKVVETWWNSTLAHDKQKPHENRTWAWLLRSDSYGIGKSLLLTIVRLLNGQHNSKHLEQTELLDRFRPWIQSTDTITCGEIEITEPYKKAKANRLQELISEETHSVEEKMVNPRQHFGMFRIYLASNAKNPIPFQKGDRRYFVNSTDSRREDILKDDPAFFAPMFKFIKNPNAIRHLHHWLMNYKISKDFSISEPLLTSDKQLIIKGNLSKLTYDIDSYCQGYAADFVNKEMLLDEIRRWEKKELIKSQKHEDYHHERKFSKIEFKDIDDWLLSVGAVPLQTKGGTKTLDIWNKNFNTKGKKRWWVWKNKEFWNNQTDKKKFTEHLEGNLKAPSGELFQFKQKEAV